METSERFLTISCVCTVSAFSVFLSATEVAAATGPSVVGALDKGGLGYVFVFLLAAVPWIEIFFVVPAAVGLGMDPVFVAALAFLGNVLPVFLILAARGRFSDWWNRRRGDDEPSRRARRASRLFDRYGTPGLGLSAPMTTGVHLGALVAVFLGAPNRSVAVWMTLGVALWTVVFTVGSTVGLSLLGTLL